MGAKRINEINNESMNFSKRKIINDSLTNGKLTRVAYTEHVADKLVAIFDAPKSRNFFLKCAWHLSEDTIWSAVDDSQKKSAKNPIGLFIYLCSNAMRRLSIRH